MLNRLLVSAAIALPFAALSNLSASAQTHTGLPSLTSLGQRSPNINVIRVVRPRRTNLDRPLRSTPQFVVCGYNRNLRPNPLGEQATITVTEVSGSSVFRYEKAGVGRSLTLYDTPIRLARRQLANSPAQYASLIGLSLNDPIVLRGFSAVDRLLSCADANDRSAANTVRFNSSAAIAGAAGGGARPTLSTSARSNRAGAEFTTIASLPDGNYRFTTAQGGASRGFINGELQESGDRVFTFRKSGESVTGNFVYIDSGQSACVSGVLQGNTVVGQAFTNSFGTDVLGQRYLGPSLSLQLGNGSGNSAVLSLSGFSRINAGSVQPPTSCRS